MEVGVWIVGVLLRVLCFITAPFFWLRTRKEQRVPPIKDPLLMKSATKLAAEIRNGELTSENLVSRYVLRIQEVNPYINAVVEDRFQAAMEEARDVDRKISEARGRGDLDKLVADKPLLGVPFTVKESCSLAGMSNSVGCLEFLGRRALTDGGGVSRVRAAGGIPLLVSATPELCLGWETTSLLRGHTNNPYGLARTPGGSSGGEAALVSSGASVISVSSDIAGSIRIPAAFCGLYGHKPTPGIIPISGHIPTLQDEQYARFLTVGPITRYSEDLPLMMKVLAGDRAHELDLDTPVALHELKVYFMTEASRSVAFSPVELSIQRAILAAVQHLQSRGATVCEDKFNDFEDAVEMSASVFFSMKDIPNMLQDPANPKREKNLILETLKTLLGSGSRTLQALGFEVLKRKRLFVPKEKVPHYIERTDRLRETMERALGCSGVFLFPSHSCSCHAHGGVFVKAAGVVYTMPFNALGLPATSVPIPGPGPRPVAVQVVAGPGQDRLCLAVARELENKFGGWTPP
ncbi:fatty-acid amide hydrolase 2-A-like isoform X1 [Danaus plexippus]|uniref:fatty-acid amide hydrolase 2-A-like isoform X1 n=2 Tax=Danaus plexippus TaxID=13037 RepID=UPI002AB0FC32|nr:fatty-acid amide hydrolase 2-A-like isoform X1 [Danaus plexippus]XP_032512781.2 fatty-acid amide hydrolase 2-A-like isoform X1 [Danaus plexippus]